jgi:hypothetical protein
MYKVPQKKARLRNDTPKRFPPKEYKAYQDHIKGIGVCQVCEVSTNLDTPHHTKQGANKDDRSLICICIECHDILHRVGFETLAKTRLELLEIGEENWSSYENT